MNTETERVNSRSYEEYHKLGGIINEGVYRSAMERAGDPATLPDETLVIQAKNIARVSGMHFTKDELREVIALYGVLRNDLDPGAEFHHGQMSDERLVAEALRMLNHPGQLKKLMGTYPHQSMK